MGLLTQFNLGICYGRVIRDYSFLDFLVFVALKAQCRLMVEKSILCGRPMTVAGYRLFSANMTVNTLHVNLTAAVSSIHISDSLRISQRKARFIPFTRHAQGHKIPPVLYTPLAWVRTKWINQVLVRTVPRDLRVFQLRFMLFLHTTFNVPCRVDLFPKLPLTGGLWIFVFFAFSVCFF